MSSSCKIIFIRYALTFVGEVVALVSQKPSRPRDKFILYGELLYTSREITSEFEFFMYLVDETVTRKILLIDLESRSDK